MIKFEISITRRHLFAFAAIVAVVALMVPTAGWAADKFTDVPDSNIFHDDIAWMADAGVTIGCNPPTNDKFCPGDIVRRETMAAFMRRLAENEVVNAATAVTAESAAVAFLADDADMLDGKDSSQFAQTKDVYTKAEIDASTASVVVAGGRINSAGALDLNYSSFGSFTVAGTAGAVEVKISNQTCTQGYLPLVTATADRGLVTARLLVAPCPTDNSPTASITWLFETYDLDGTPAAKSFDFVLSRASEGLNPG